MKYKDPILVKENPKATEYAGENSRNIGCGRQRRHSIVQQTAIWHLNNLS